ncbi:MAG TPA: ATP-binding cassette domain-containing protein [Tepiditoga sp.]|nr:ATP-binding cassette domain-containing protein [Thermotogota bacterium]HOO73684.1 ATP-binding cassette domain-containing protein [Tepiditoga sp.]
MFEIKNLTFGYSEGKNIFKNFNFTLGGNEIISVLGPSGCGKTTLIKIISGIIKNYSGSIFIDNEKIDNRINTIALIPQNYGLLKWKTVYENIELVYKIKKIKPDKEKIIKISEKLEIKNILGKYPEYISGGQKQRAAIARAFLTDPQLMLMDEPFSALDEFTREKIQNLFLKLRSEKKIPTVIITHSIEEAIFLGEKIAVFRGNENISYNMYNNNFSGCGSEKSSDYFKFYSDLKNEIKRGSDYDN